MRVTPKMAIFCLIAGVLPPSAGLGLAWILSKWTQLGATPIAWRAACCGLAVLALVVTAAILLGRSFDRGAVVDPEPAPGQDEPFDMTFPSPDPRIDLSGLCDALAAEHKGPPGPTLRKLFQYARPSAHRPKLVSVNSAVDVCVRAMQPSVAAGCSLSFDPDPNVGMARLDPDSFHQLLLNLIVNAREAAGPSGQIDIRTQALDGTVLVAVRDDGSGVPPEEIERIFEPFFSTKKGAPGLGLTICRRIAEAHGGTIWATNILPRGLEVGVRLPQ